MNNKNEKKCRVCGETKSMDCFSLHHTARDGRYNLCEQCRKNSYLPFNRNSYIKKTGYVYLIGANNSDLVKLGTTNNIKNRMSSLVNESPIELTLIHKKYADNPGKLERDLHSIFKNNFSHGEWFHLTTEQIKEAIKFIEEA